jgi:hypothetical protein
MMDIDASGSLDSQEFCAALRKLVALLSASPLCSMTLYEFHLEILEKSLRCGVKIT